MRTLLSPRQQEAPFVYELQREEPLLVSVCLSALGLATLRQQLKIDLNEKGFDCPSLRVKHLQLLDLERLLLAHPNRELVEADDNIMLTHQQCALLASYAGRYYHRAWACRDAIQLQVYSELLMASTTLSTVTFASKLPLAFLYDGLFAYARPLSVLWSRLCAHFTGHQRPELHSFEPGVYATL